MEPTGLVKELADFTKTSPQINDYWAITLSACFVGAMAGHNRFLPNQLGNVTANIQTILIGASGIAFKTVPINSVIRPLLKKLSERKNEKILESFGYTPEEFKLHKEETKTLGKNGKEYKKRQIQINRMRAR